MREDTGDFLRHLFDARIASALKHCYVRAFTVCSTFRSNHFANLMNKWSNVVCFYLFIFQVMLEITTMVRGTPWSLTESAWLTTCCSIMGSTERWRYMYVELQSWCVSVKFPTRFLCVSGTNLSFFCFSVHTKPAERKWPSITAMITSNSCVQSDQTTCQSTANRCRDVSFGQRVGLCAKSFVFSAWLSFCPCPTVNVGEDCPVFDGLFEFCQLSGGGSVGKFML